MPTIAEQIRVLLYSLGATPDEVADSLRARGIRGVVEDPCWCPIAVLIRREIPGADDTDQWATDPDDGGFFVCKDYIRVPDDADAVPPLAVYQFIELFDINDPGGRYEDLREADPYLAVLDEEHAEDWQAWKAELTAKARKLAEKLDGAR